MTDPTQAPRKSIEQLASEHKAPRAAWIVALVLGAFSIYKLAAEGTGEKPHMFFHGGLLAVAILCVPGLTPWLAGNVKVMGGALAPYLPWSKGKSDG